MRLVIVESPTKARTLGKFLGSDYQVMATMGHIKDLPKSTLGVDVEHNFAPEYVDVAKRKDTIAEIKKDAKEAESIFIASDPDREGEAIASHVKEILKENKKQKSEKIFRVAFHEITKEAVEEAIAHPREIDKNLVDAQTSRRVLDRLVGYKLSPLLWRKVRRGLSAGRVQTVAVRLIVEREREIKAFKPVEYWEIYAVVEPKDRKGEFTVQLVKLEVKNKDQADKIVADLNHADYVVSEVKKREVVKSPYPPFTTSTMTQAAARIFGWSAKRTMSVAQRLYEEGLITYHRTDSFNLAGAAVERARAFIGKEYGAKYLPEKARFFKTTSKVAQEAHEAIRPTNIEHTVEKLELKGEKGAKEFELLYGLIWRRFAACQMAAAVYDETVIDVTANNIQHTTYYILRASGQIMKFDGWRKLFKTNEEGVILPELTQGEPLKLIKVDPFQKFTEPPARFNEASLIKTLEKLGIGRPSTYAPTITTIQVRNYVEKEDGKFSPTVIGFAVNDFMIGNFPDVFDYAFTAGMEDDLDKIANGEKEWTQIIGAFWKPFDKKLEEVGKTAKRVKIETEKLGRACPECKEGELVVRLGRFGKFISCSRFPDCKYTEKFIDKIGVKCPECEKGSLPRAERGDVVVKKSGKGRKFYGCSRYPECKWASWKAPQKPQSGDIIAPVKGEN